SCNVLFFFSNRERHTRSKRDWIQTCALPISFELTEKDGKLYGRGTTDDKGPLLASMYALKAILDEGYKLNQRVRFIFGADEESLWRCMDAYTAKEELPNMGFTPDSSFPLNYAEKGLIEFYLHTNE